MNTKIEQNFENKNKRNKKITSNRKKLFQKQQSHLLIDVKNLQKKKTKYFM